MERDELIHRISVGSAYIQRADITQDQHDSAQRRIAYYRQQLRDLDEKEARREPDERVIKSIAAIREILKPIPKER